MRDYGMVSPKFWIGETGRALRKDPYAQRVAFYLMTAPQSEMTGVYYCSKMSILNDVGSPCEAPSVGYEPPLKGLEGGLQAVERALKALCELGFCFYDFDSEWIFVTEMARCQIAESLSPKDNRVSNLKKLAKAMPAGLREKFIERYNDDFCLGFDEKKPSPLEAPSKPLRSQEQEQEQEQDINNHNKETTESRYGCDSGSGEGFFDFDDSLKSQIEHMEIDELSKVVNDMRTVLNPVQVIGLAKAHGIKVNRSDRLNAVCGRKVLTLDNVRRCIEVCKQMRKGGQYLVGIMENAANEPNNYHTDAFREAERAEWKAGVDEDAVF